MEQTNKVKKPTISFKSEEEVVTETAGAQEISMTEMMDILKKQSLEIEKLKKKVAPVVVDVDQSFVPEYRLGTINNRVIKSVFNDKRTAIDDRGKSYVVQEFIVSFFDGEPERMSMTVFREMVKRIKTKLVRTIYSEIIDPITGRPPVDSFELLAIDPQTGEEQTYIISKDFVNI
jgi:hypothetical protein